LLIKPSSQLKETPSCDKNSTFNPTKETGVDMDLEADKDITPLEWAEQDDDKDAPKSYEISKKMRPHKHNVSTHENKSSMLNPPLATTPWPAMKLT
jgi:hypothetical protein